MVFSIPVFKELEDLVKGLQRVKVVREASSYPHICTKLQKICKTRIHMTMIAKKMKFRERLFIVKAYTGS